MRMRRSSNLIGKTDGSKAKNIFTYLQIWKTISNKWALKDLESNKHPESIYIEPINGLMYFVRGNSIGSEFGFPRLGIK